MSEKEPSATVETVDTYTVDGDEKGIQLAKIDLEGKSTTELFEENGTYVLMRVNMNGR